MITLSGLSDPLEIHDTFLPWASAVQYLGLLIGSELLYTKHLHTVAANKATGVLPLLTRDSTLTQPTKLNPLQTTHLFHRNLRLPYSQFRKSLQLPQTPSYPKQVYTSHRKLSQTYPHFPFARHSEH